MNKSQNSMLLTHALCEQRRWSNHFRRGQEREGGGPYSGIDPQCMEEQRRPRTESGAMGEGRKEG